MHNGDWNHGTHSGGWWMVIMMVVFWGGLIVLGVALLRRSKLAGQPPVPTSTAQTILAERLARGEIEVDEYRSRLAVLGERPGG